MRDPWFEKKWVCYFDMDSHANCVFYTILCSAFKVVATTVIFCTFCFVFCRFDVGKSKKVGRLFQRHNSLIQDLYWIVAGMMWVEMGEYFSVCFCRVEKSTKQIMGEQEMLWKHLLLACVSIAVLSFSKLVQLFQSRVLYKRQTECF